MFLPLGRERRRGRYGEDRAPCSAVPAIGVLLAVVLPFFMGYVLAMIGVALLILWGAERVVPYKKRFPYVGG